LAFSGSPYFDRALFEVTSGGVFWIVAVGPERWTMRGLVIDTSAASGEDFTRHSAGSWRFRGKIAPFGGVGQS
jgi:hypothetical protein